MFFSEDLKANIQFEVFGTFTAAMRLIPYAVE
jgi:hypothetical protein